MMNIRNIIFYALTLMAYTLSLAHSMIPHHHHKTLNEAAAHKHGDHQHASDHHHHDENENDEDEKSGDGHFFFFSHDLNADVLINHSAIENAATIKKLQTAVVVKEQIISFSVSAHLVFRPPQNEPSFTFPIFLSGTLRGPPSILI